MSRHRVATLGVLRGLADVDGERARMVIGADSVIGTSARSSVAAQVTSGIPLDELYDAQRSQGFVQPPPKHGYRTGAGQDRPRQPSPAAHHH
jgi:hypothetical protein